MHVEPLAARIVRIDDLISTLTPHDPSFVERRLAPRRARAWQTFRSKFSASCSSADAWEFVHIITKGVQ